MIDRQIGPEAPSTGPAPCPTLLPLKLLHGSVETQSEQDRKGKQLTTWPSCSPKS